ncbi:MAG: hypothetical protein ABL930_09425 [Pseudobdellovibrio sp.]
MLYNNLETFFNSAGSDLAVVSTYRHATTVANFEDKVRMQVISASGSISEINLPTVTPYRWGWKNVNSVAQPMCYFVRSIDNLKGQIYYLVFCNGNIGFKSYIFSLNTTTKMLSTLVETSDMVHNISINQQDELVYITHRYESATQDFTYTLRKYVNNSVIGTVKLSELSGFVFSNVVILQNQSGEYFVNLFKSAQPVNTYGFYSFSSKTIKVAPSFTRNITELFQDSVTKKLYYFSFAPQQTNMFFNISLSNFAETKNSEDTRYIYKHQVLGNGIVTKYGQEYNSGPQGHAWISYNEGKSFKEILNVPLQTNQILKTINNEYYLLGVNQFSGTRVIASVYKLKAR